MHHLLDHEFDLSRFDTRYRNEQSGAPAYPSEMLLKITNCIHNGHLATNYSGTLRDCLPCELRDKSLRTPEKTKVRQVAFFRGKAAGEPESHSDRMKRAIDSEDGRRRYGRRLATVEPVFGNLRHNKRLDRFTLRGRTKVDTQWKLYCLLHNIEKLAHHGFGQ